MSDSWAVKYRPVVFSDMLGNVNQGVILREAVKRHQEPPAIFLAGTRGSGKCIIKSSVLLTANGLELAGDIFPEGPVKRGDFVEFKYPLINMYGEVEMTSHAYYNGFEQCYTVKTEHGYSITCTLNHPLYTKDNYGVTGWVAVSDLVYDSFDKSHYLAIGFQDMPVINKLHETGSCDVSIDIKCEKVDLGKLLDIKEGLVEYSGFYFDKVVSVEDAGEQETIDFTLPVTHSFIANNIVSHNTTSARIYAKAMCCEHPTPEGEPCNECDSCKDIMDGSYPDVIELDAASENSVHGIRDLIKSLSYLPTRGDKKVVILDEVHCLSQAANNALLKTLEEPPEFVRFVFCTTEPEKVLETIRSRCLMFRFNDITTRDIEARLKYIAQQENVFIDDAALNAIARNSNGGMRDAIMLLEQAHLANVNNEVIKPSNILELVGSVSVRDIQKLFMSIKSGDHVQLLEWLESIKFAPIDILNSSISFLETVVLIKQGVSPAEFVSKDLVAGVMSLASTISFHDVAVMFEEFKGIIYDLRSLNGVNSSALFKLRMLGVLDKLTYQPVINGQVAMSPQTMSFLQMVKQEFNVERIPLPDKAS